jgi:hypothetical protein
MQRIDAWVDASFEEQLDGSLVFYPWGRLARGRQIRDPEREARLRAFLRWFVLLSLPVAVLAGPGTRFVTGAAGPTLVATAMACALILGLYAAGVRLILGPDDDGPGSRDARDDDGGGRGDESR